MRSPIRAPTKPAPSGWSQWLPLVADAARLVKGLRDRPRAVDWLALAVEAAHLGVRAQAQVGGGPGRCAWDYFDDDGPTAEWVEVPLAFQALVMRYVEGISFDETYWGRESHAPRVVVAHVDGHAVGWVQAAGEHDVVDGPYVRRGVEAETYAAVGRAAWASLGTEHLSYGPYGLVPDRFEDDGGPRSALADKLLARIQAFRIRGRARSVLLVGAPGTGKSHAIRSIAHALDATTLRVEVAALLDQAEGPSDDDLKQGLDTLVTMLDPGVIVLDDIDRAGTDVRLLRFLEDASQSGRVVLASANRTAQMLGALLRPGRFDEVVRYEQLDRRLLEQILDGHAHLVPRVAHLPMAYVREFVARIDVLGEAHALAELEELEARARTTASG
ncbi:MAG: ATP-binding protein [Myxococcota bacterium]